MEPKQTGPNLGFENAPTQNEGSAEFGVPQSLPELDNQLQFENQQEREKAAVVEHEGVPPVITALPSDDVAQPQVDPAGSAATDDTPLVAGDDDLIEKEWIEKAKKIIEDTRDDPYTRERSISKLQVEYIRKRYGREIGESSE